MLTVKLVYKLSDVPEYLKWATNTHHTIYTHFQGISNIINGFDDFFLPVHPYICPSIFVFTRPNDRWTGLYIKL